jgi:hypothetical protein
MQKRRWRELLLTILALVAISSYLIHHGFTLGTSDWAKVLLVLVFAELLAYISRSQSK